jgi:hypothetical protein
VKLDLPVNQQNQPPPPIDPIKNKVVVDAKDQVSVSCEVVVVRRR